jgi:hypothetical protein
LKGNLYRKAVQLIGVMIMILFVGGMLFPPKAPAAEKNILFLHTNNVTGHLFPCPT